MVLHYSVQVRIILHIYNQKKKKENQHYSRKLLIKQIRNSKKIQNIFQ